MFSSRTNWNLSPNQLNRLLEDKSRQGVSILDLTESNPTRCGLTYNPEILKALSTDKSLLYEPNPRGLLAARNVVAEEYRSHGIHLDANNIFLTAGTSEAYGYLFRLLCNPGDNVLVPKPSYPLFDYLCELNDVEARHYRLRYTDEWQIDFSSLREAVDSSTRAILIVHPNNPTGSFVKPGERGEITELAQKHRLPLMVDEVFMEYGLHEGREVPGSFGGEEHGLVFTLNGISKTLGLPQMKVAWITASGTREFVDDAMKRLEVIADTYLTVGTPVQQALEVFFREGKNVTQQIQRRVRENFKTACILLAKTPLSLLETEAGWNTIIRLPETQSDEEWALNLLKVHDTLVYPGHFFEIDRETCVVLSLLPDKSVFEEGLRRLILSVTSKLSDSH